MTCFYNTLLTRAQHKRQYFRNSYKFLFTAILFSVFAINSFAQQHSNYNLLWRISGKGLSKPSYLFGTMHVKDKRAFDFSDSVMLAIQNCRSFALETHPDTIVKKMLVSMTRRAAERSLRNMLSKDNYDKLAARFQKKNGYPMGDIDPIQAQAMLQPEREKADDKQSFVDAYLFGVARGLNKNTYGLEDGSEQFDTYFGASSPYLKGKINELLEDEDEEEEINQLEELITTYSTGNLDNIVEYLGDERLNDSILVVRNNVMVKSMIGYMADAPLFAAVGVAHLPGDNGIIALLRKQGYTLTPVEATFTGVSNKFNTDYTKLKWLTYTDDSRGYAMDVPFTPIQTDVLMGLPTVVYADITNDVVFGAYAVLQGSADKPVIEKTIMDRLLKRLTAAPNMQVVSNKKVLVSGVNATDITVKTGKKTGLRYLLMIKGNMVYCFYAGNTLTRLNQSFANRFFSSVKLTAPVVQRGKGWVTLKNDTAAFSIKIPSVAKSVEKLVPGRSANSNPTFKLYMAIDSNKFENYLVRFNDYPPGLYIESPEKAFDAIFNEYKAKGIKINNLKTIEKDGYEGREALFNLQDYKCKVQMFTRGNRIYLLLKQSLSPNAALSTDDDFFTSFKFTPYQPATFKDYSVPGGNFKAKVLGVTKEARDSTKSYHDFLYSDGAVYSVNPSSGSTYIVEHATISKYYRTKSIDSVYNSFLSGLVKDDEVDTLIKTDTISINGISGREYIVRKKTGASQTRTLVFIQGSEVIDLFAHQSKEDDEGETSKAFYNSLMKVHDAAPIDLQASKANLILTDLSSPDSVTRMQAVGALTYYKFEKEDLPALYAAIRKPMHDDSLSYGTRTKLVYKLRKLNDSTTVAELKQLCTDTATPVAVKGDALQVIAAIDKKDGYKTYMDLLTAHQDNSKESYYSFFSPLYDSLDYVTTNYDKIAPLLKRAGYRENVLSIFNSMLYNNNKGKYDAFVAAHYDDLVSNANDDLNAYLADKDSSYNKWTMRIYYYLNYMQKVKGKPFTAAFTSKLLKDGAPTDNLSDAVTARLLNKLPVQQPLLNKMLDSAELRYDMLRTLSEVKQLARAPQKYRTQAAFAKLALTKYANEAGDEDESSVKATQLGTLTDKGDTYYVFQFQSDYEDADKFVGICGPYKAGSTTLDFKSYRAYSNWEVKQTNWQKQARAMIPALKKSVADDLKVQ